MSYCVNCGVELDATAQSCALCNTPVYNPNEATKVNQQPPYPMETGQVERVKRKDVGILLSTVVLATAITCALLNLYVFYGSRWSLAVIGACIILWVILIPMVIYTKQPIYLSILFDGLAIAGYLYMLTFMVKSDGWFWGLGLPIVGLVTILVEAVTAAWKKLPKSFLTNSLYMITAIGILCPGIELLINRYMGKKMMIGWSAVVLTVCVIVDIAVITMLSLRRLRNAVRRTLHF